MILTKKQMYRKLKKLDSSASSEPMVFIHKNDLEDLLSLERGSW